MTVTLVRSPFRLLAVLLGVAALCAFAAASTSTLAVPKVTIGRTSNLSAAPTPLAQQLAPSACGSTVAGLNNLVLATSGQTSGVSGKNSLILGENGANDLGTKNTAGNDCCVFSSAGGQQKGEQSCAKCVTAPNTSKTC
jgi:hypothetical protein